MTKVRDERWIAMLLQNNCERGNTLHGLNIRCLKIICTYVSLNHLSISLITRQTLWWCHMSVMRLKSPATRLYNGLFMLTTKEAKLHITDFCEWTSLVIGGFPSQRASIWKVDLCNLWDVCVSNFLVSFSNVFHWITAWALNIGSGNGLVSSGNKP